METKPLQVLVVDDDIDAAETMAMLLELHGHRTAVVHDGFEVLEASVRVQPDVVLLDVGLPGINGYQAAALIRQDHLVRDTFLIALTGWDSDAHRRASAEAGFDIHLTKPVEHEALLEVLETVKRRRTIAAGPVATEPD
jgi:CheY-like chemotaxis protein